MKIYEELQARGLIAQVTDEEEVRELINGGSSLDTAKGINIVRVNGGSILDYAAADYKPCGNLITKVKKRIDMRIKSKSNTAFTFFVRRFKPDVDF